MATADLETLRIVCRRCFSVLDAEDAFCRRCGQPTSEEAAAANRAIWGESGSPAVNPGPPAKAPSWTESPWIVVPAIFLALGPLGLPMLWRSRQITVFWKAALTAGIVGLTALVIWGVSLEMNRALAPLGELHKALGQ